jgi:uncharacterized protein YqeY
MIDNDTLIEAYSILKQYIPVKDRQEAADNLMSSMVDLLNDQELKELGAVDSALTKAFKEYAGAIEDEEELEEYDDE